MDTKHFHIWYPAAFSSQQQLQGNHSQQQGKAAGIQAQLAFHAGAAHSPPLATL
jgi:hypothetical protein